MSRLGYLCDGDYFDSGVEGICEGCSLPGLDAEGIFTHFAVSDEFGEECDLPWCMETRRRDGF